MRFSTKDMTRDLDIVRFLQKDLGYQEPSYRLIYGTIGDSATGRPYTAIVKSDESSVQGVECMVICPPTLEANGARMARHFEIFGHKVTDTLLDKLNAEFNKPEEAETGYGEPVLRKIVLNGPMPILQR